MPLNEQAKAFLQDLADQNAPPIETLPPKQGRRLLQHSTDGLVRSPKSIRYNSTRFPLVLAVVSIVHWGEKVSQVNHNQSSSIFMAVDGCSATLKHTTHFVGGWLSSQAAR